jgi:outer membrane protein TolC
LFDGGRLKNQVAIAESRQLELVENYRQAILTALKEVEDALNNAAYSVQQTEFQEQIAAQVSESRT